MLAVLKPAPQSPTRLLLCLAQATLVLAPTSRLLAVDYVKDIKPLLKAHCYTCHGALKQKAGLRLDTVASMRKGGDDGSILKAGHPSLLERVTTTDKDDRMPPEGEGPLLKADEIALLKAWLAAGATGPANEAPEPDPRAHWAYQAPKSSGKSLDALLATRLAARQLKPQPEAAPELWLRRVYLDLIGLPPSPEQITDFARDTSPQARQRVVDHLLATPQYGERWARHFMDIWRYCDWYGLGEQLRYSQKHIWHWRDWIVESLNADKGYDRMVVQMLAADEAAPSLDGTAPEAAASSGPAAPSADDLDAMSKELGRTRANEVRNALIADGVTPGRITVRGRGAEEPVSENDTPRGRLANRRVALQLLVPER